MRLQKVNGCVVKTVVPSSQWADPLTVDPSVPGGFRTNWDRVFFESRAEVAALSPHSPFRSRHMTPLPGTGRVATHDVHVIPGLSGDARYRSCADTVENARSALLERVFYHEIGGVFTTPKCPTLGTVTGALAEFTRRIGYRVRRLTPVPLAEYPASVYRGRKLLVYTRAAELVARRGVLVSDAMISAFIKFEKLLDASFGNRKRVVPRVIQPRRPAYNVAVGRYLHQLEHFLYRAIDSVYGRPTIMKGMNALERGHHIAEAWHSYRDPVALDSDASRFDQHVSKSVLIWEHQVYDMFYRSEELRNLLGLQLRTVGYVRCGDGGLRYVVVGGRCSGDMNTAMGNCLIVSGAYFSLLHDLQLVNSRGARVSLFCDGDDVIVIGERSDVTLIKENVPAFFDHLGFVMKVGTLVDNLEDVMFCQCKPVFDGTDWRMVRDVHVSLSKDAVLLHSNPSPTYLRHQLNSIGYCGLALTSGLPILQEYYMACIRGGKSGGSTDERFVESGFYRLSVGMESRWSEVTNDARCSFARAFGIPPDLQLALEEYFRGLDLAPVESVTTDEQPRVIGV